jgi:hypothetical protein
LRRRPAFETKRYLGYQFVGMLDSDKFPAFLISNGFAAGSMLTKKRPWRTPLFGPPDLRNPRVSMDASRIARRSLFGT